MKEPTIPRVSRYFSDKEDFMCIHGVPFDSECGECIEDKKIVDDGRKIRSLSIQKFNYKEKLESSKHPLKNEASKHYELWKDLEVIELIEKVLTKEELIGACKFNILKYRLRIGNKDETGKELQKIKDYENYLKFLEGEEELKKAYIEGSNDAWKAIKEKK